LEYLQFGYYYDYQEWATLSLIDNLFVTSDIHQNYWNLPVHYQVNQRKYGILKQYKLFVEEGEIDFELLQISSAPCTIKDIPSLVQNKYIYLNEGNDETTECLNLFFSDQTVLAYVEDKF
jgi:hypothetical protein